MSASAGDPAGRRAWALAAAAVAAVAFLPFVRMIASGSTVFFRDLSRYFLPMRLFVLEGLRQGELRFWNPYDNEGLPNATLPVGYPLELLQALWPTPGGITLVTALHFPLAAVAFVVLARRLGLRPAAAAGGAVVYALGGFALSMVNLYVYVHTLAWAPLVVWAGLRAADGGRRALAIAALACGIALSTTGLELVLQTLVVSAALAFRPRDPRRLLRVAAAALLGLGLSAPVFAVLGRTTAGTARASGFTANAVLNQSVHPLTLVQVVVGDLFGRLANVTNEWWGGRFFENGFPYVMSLYLGALALALAAAGLASRREHRLALAGILVAATMVCLGRWAGWTPLIEAIPMPWRILRYPTKAFFSVHLVVALLAAYGLDAIAAAERRATRVLLFAGGAGAAVLVLAPFVLPAAGPWILPRLFTSTVPHEAAQAALAHVGRDAAVGGAVLLAAAAIVFLAGRGRLPAPSAARAAAVLLAVDLLRTGAGLNPTMDVRLFRISAETERLVETLRPVRIHSCDPFRSQPYWDARAARPGRHVVFTFLVMREMLFPHFNVTGRTASALGEDLTGLVPEGRTGRGYVCGPFDGIADRLREAAVTHVFSLEPLPSPHLEPLTRFTSAAIDPATVYVYALRGARPRVALIGTTGSARIDQERADALAIDVAADADGELLVRDGYGAGWRATVDGRPAPIAAHEGRHRRVAVPAGTHRVEMRYHPPGLAAGLAASAATVAFLAFLWRRPRTA